MYATRCICKWLQGAEDFRDLTGTQHAGAM